jgi:uncharacterized protein (TIGR03435 family)
MKGIVLTICLVATLGFAQQARPSFEVASIKLSKLNEGSDSESSPGRIQLQGTLKSIIRTAYGVQPNQIEGGPKWIDEEHYEIDARAIGPAQGQPLLDMLQTLLSERFKLELHRETKVTLGYALVRGKADPKMKQVSPGSSHSNGGPGRLTAQAMTMSGLAARLTRIMGISVVDETGIQGAFDFSLTWAPEKSTPNPVAIDTATDSGGPSIFTAVQDQLGLKLESHKVPVEFLIVDRAERPILN